MSFGRYRRPHVDNKTGPRKSLMRAQTAMSTTSSPKRRPLGQPPGIGAADCRTDPDLARQHVPAEDAQAREAQIIRIRRMTRATAGKRSLASRDPL